MISRSSILLFFTFSFLFTMEVKATHIVGGELNYTCLGGNEYEITLTVYRDCFYGEPWFDDPASVGIFNQNNELIRELGDNGELRMQLGDDDTLNQQLNDPCFIIPPDVCVHTTTYRDTIDLPFREGGYTLAYQRCCRNQTILNIVDPLASGATYLVRISEESLRQCNSNAKFKSWPPIYICVDEPIDFDHGATDPDGDSLVYSLCTPLLGATQANPRPQPPNNPPYDSVVWVEPPYSINNMLGGDPLTIDPETGFLTGIPNTIGQFVVGICVEEYRNGDLISVTRRDFQYNVGVCGKTTAAFFSAEFYCENQELIVENQSQDAEIFEWYLNSPNYQDTIITEENPIFKGVEAGVYTLTLIASNPRGCRDTFSTEIIVIEVPLEADFSVSFGECSDSVTISTTNLSIINDTGRIDTNWYLLINDTTIASSPPFTLSLQDSAYIILELVASNGCPSRDSFLFYRPYIQSSVPDTMQVCRGQSVFINPQADPGCNYTWSPSNFLNDPNAPNPLSTPTDDLLYEVLISKDDKCDFIDSVYVDVLEIAEIISFFPDNDSVLIGESNLIFYQTQNADSLIWIPSEVIIEQMNGSVLVQLDETLTLRLFALNNNGCNDTASLQLFTYIPPCEEPFIFIPNAFSPNGDGVNDHFAVRGRVLNNLEGFVYNRWGEKVFTFEDPDDRWDGRYKGKQAPIDGYGYYIRYQCIPGGPYTIRKGNVSLIR